MAIWSDSNHRLGRLAQKEIDRHDQPQHAFGQNVNSGCTAGSGTEIYKRGGGHQLHAAEKTGGQAHRVGSLGARFTQFTEELLSTSTNAIVPRREYSARADPPIAHGQHHPRPLVCPDDHCGLTTPPPYAAPAARQGIGSAHTRYRQFRGVRACLGLAAVSFFYAA